MPFGQTTDRRIARHVTDTLPLQRYHRRPYAHSRGDQRRLAAGMAATDHDYVEVSIHGFFSYPLLSGFE
jgi:hypothetical protein